MDIKDDQSSPGEILLMTIDLHLASFIAVTIFLRVEHLMTPL